MAEGRRGLVPAPLRRAPAALQVAVWMVLWAGEIVAQGSLSARPVGSTAAALGYQEYLPGPPAPPQGHALLVFLHGSGESGNGSTDLPRVLETGLPALLAQGDWPAAAPGGAAEADRFVILAPQTSDGFPSWTEVQDFLDFAIANYAVDPERVYLTGLSAGAFTILGYLRQHAASGQKDRVAAVVPIAGAGDPSSSAVCPHRRFPLWAFHGTEDDRVPPSGSVDIVETLRGCEPPPVPGAVRLSLFDGAKHTRDVWNRVYDLDRMGTASPDADPFDMSIYDWMLQYRRGGVPEDAIFIDGFESADTSLWTTAVP